MLDLVVSGDGVVVYDFFFAIFSVLISLPYTGGQGEISKYLSSFLPLLIFNEKDIELS